MNKKYIVIIFLFTFFIMILSACTKPDKGYKQIKQTNYLDCIPTLQLEYKIGWKRYKVSVDAGTSTFYNGSSITETDAFGPLNSEADLPFINKNKKLNRIRINFTTNPSTYTVRCWTDNYIGQNEAYNKYKEVEISNDTINVPDDEYGYVYEIHASWSQCNAYYSFRISNDK